MRNRTSKANASSSHFTAAGTSGYSRTGMIAAAGMERFVRIQNASNSVHLGAVAPARFGFSWMGRVWRFSKRTPGFRIWCGSKAALATWNTVQNSRWNRNRCGSAYGVDDPLGALGGPLGRREQNWADQPPP